MELQPALYPYMPEDIVLFEETEVKLNEFLKTMAKHWFSLTKEDDLEIVKRFVKQNSLLVKFLNYCPSQD